MTQKHLEVVSDIEEESRGCLCCFTGFFKLFRTRRRLPDEDLGDNAAATRQSPTAVMSMTSLTDDVNLVEKEEAESKAVKIEEVDETTEEESVLTGGFENLPADVEENVSEHNAVKSCAEELDEDEEEKENVELKTFDNAVDVNVVKEEVEPKVVKTWAEEMEEKENEAAALASTHRETSTSAESEAAATTSTHCETSTSAGNEVTTTAATHCKMSASQRRRDRRKTIAAACRVKMNETRPSCAETTPATTSTNEPVVEVLWQNGRTREEADALAKHSRQEPQERPNRTLAGGSYKKPTRPSPTVLVFGRDGRPLVCTWEEAAYGAFHSRKRQESRERPNRIPAAESYRKPTRPSPTVRVFGRDGRPLVCTWEEAAYGTFHTRKYTQGSSRGGRGRN